MVIVMIEKIKKIIKENRWIFITFLVSSIIISTIYILQGIAPFGKNSMLDVDFYHQYGPLLNELYDRVKSGESLIYSFNTGGGIPFYRNFLNYLSSPFNLILLLFKKENIVMAFSLVIALKAMFSSVFMSFYLKNTFKKNNVLICAFSLLYTFSGYFCAYYWNIMWLDGIVFLPIIMYGINKIIDENKPVCYILSLAIMLFANYFIAYMICIFSCLYFLGVLIYKCGFNIKKILKKCIVFGFSSLLAAGLVAFAILPLYSSLSSISATKDSFPSITSNFKITDYLFNHIPSVNRTVFASDSLPLPNVYCGLITICAILLLFVNKKVSIKSRFFCSLALLFFFFTFNINTLDFVWHAFHVPNDLPYRYSFIYVFVLSVIGFYSLNKLDRKDNLKISLVTMTVIIFVLLASKLGFKNLSDDRVIVCLILIIGFYLIYLLSFIKKIPKRVLRILLILLVSIECIYSINVNWVINHDIKSFMSDKKYYKYLVDITKKFDNDLYRIEKTDYLTLNDGAWYDYNGISTFTSMAYESVSNFQRKFGLAGNNINSYYYKQTATPIYNTIFNVRYLMGDYVDNDTFSLMNTKNNHNLYRFDYPTSIGYAINKEIENLELVDYAPFINQSNFVLSATGVNDIFTPLKVTNVLNGSIFEESFENNSNGEFNYDLTNGLNYLEFELENTKKGNIYLYVGGSGITSIDVDGSYYSITSDEYYILDIGNKDNDIVNIKINTENNMSGNLMFYAYYMNYESFNKYYSILKENLINVTKYNDLFIEGKVVAKEEQVIFTTLAYDMGYTVYVDGKKTNTKKLLDAYLGFDIKEGNHDIKIVYYPKYLKEGIIISSTSLMILIVYIYMNNNKKQKKYKKDKFNV